MDFALSDEQVLVRDTARGLLARHCPITLVRAAIDEPAAADPLWVQLREWTVIGDGSLVDLCLFVEECGAALAPGPYLPTAAFALPLLRAAGADDDADAIAAGERTATVALAGEDGQWVANDDPVKTFVLEADRVDLVVFVDAAGGLRIGESVAEPRRVGSLDIVRRYFEAPVPAAAPVAIVADVDAWLRRATVTLAAEMLGTARWLNQAAIAYAKERVQFDVPIGSFQAIQHKLADASLAYERAWSAVYYAAMCIDAADADAARATHVAKAAAGAAATRAAKDSIQVHGGIGYTWEHDLHLYLRRAYASEHLLGTSAWHHDRLADLLFA